MAKVLNFPKNPAPGQRYLNEHQAAVYLGRNVRWLRACRYEAHTTPVPPPPYLRVGRRILYDMQALDKWLAQFVVTPQPAA